MNEPDSERRKEYFDRVNNLSDRVAKLEVYQVSGYEYTKMFSEKLDTLTSEIQKMSLKINTIETQRNTMLAAAGILGGIVTSIGSGIFKFVVGNGVR